MITKSVGMLESASVSDSVGGVALLSIIFANEEQLLNVRLPMDVTPAGMMMLARDAHE